MGLLLPRLSKDPRAAWIAAFVLAATLMALPWVAGQFGNAWIRVLAFACLYVMLALGLNIVVGFAGLLDLDAAIAFDGRPAWRRLPADRPRLRIGVILSGIDVRGGGRRPSGGPG